MIHYETPNISQFQKEIASFFKLLQVAHIFGKYWGRSRF